jgi:hypothetical protein
VTFGDDMPRTLPPQQGRLGLIGLLTALRADGGDRHRPGATSLGAAISRAGALARQRALVTVVSDFRGPFDWRRPLLDVAGRHDVLAVEIRDPREEELPNAGELWLVDPETGRQLRVDTRSAKLRARFAAAAAEERALVAAWEGTARPSRFALRCGTNFAALALPVALAAERLWPVPFGAVATPLVVSVLSLALSMELWQLVQASQRRALRALLLPGLALQRLTTREPSLDETRTALLATASVLRRELDASD